MNIKKMIQDMTLEEKASLCSGADFWHTEAVDRVGLKSIKDIIFVTTAKTDEEARELLTQFNMPFAK